MASGNLTLNQVITVATIRNFVHLHGHAPTLRELAQLLDRSRGSTMQRLRSLQRKGVLKRDPRKHRTMEIIPIRPVKQKPGQADEEEDDIIG